MPHTTSRFVRWAARLLRTTDDKIELWERLILTAFFVTLAVTGLRKAHVLDVPEAWWLDRMARADRPSFNAPIVVVTIGDREYYDAGLFAGTSPLNPDALARIVASVVAHHPKGVVLDVLIHPSPGESPERAAGRQRLYRLLQQSSLEGPPMVLVRDPASEAIERMGGESAWSAFDDITRDERVTWAYPGIRRTGARLRAVPHRYKNEDGTPQELPTVLGAAVETFRLESHRSTPWWVHPHDSDPFLPWRLRFSGHFLELESSLSQHHMAASALLSQPAVGGSRSLLANKIVLIGGTHHAGRDILPTVVGDMPGVYVWAEAIGSWIRHDALREPLEPISMALEFLIGVVAGLLLARFGSFFGLILAIVVVSPLMVIFSLLTFGDRVLFVNFLPALVGVYVHYQIEVHTEIRKLNKEKKELRDENEKLKQEVAERVASA